MDTSKPWYQSTGIWGSLIAFAGFILGVFHVVSLTPDQQAHATNDAVTVASSIATIVGTVAAFIGRLKADQPIGKPVAK